MNPRPRAKPRDRNAPKRLAQLPSLSHALASNLQKHRSKTSKLIRFGSLHLRGNWGWPRTAVRRRLICSNRKFIPKNFFATVTLHNIVFCHMDSLTIFTARIHSHMYWGKICLSTLSCRSKGTLGVCKPWPAGQKCPGSWRFVVHEKVQILKRQSSADGQRVV